MDIFDASENKNLSLELLMHGVHTIMRRAAQTQVSRREKKHSMASEKQDFISLENQYSQDYDCNLLKKT